LPSRAAISALILSLCVVSGCSELVSNSEQIQVALPSQEELVGLVRVANDVVVRIAPTLTNPTAGPPLRSALNALATALNSADGPAAARALDDARVALTAYQQAPNVSSELPDLSVIDLALIRVNGLLQRPCSRSNSQTSIPTQQSCTGL